MVDTVDVCARLIRRSLQPHRAAGVRGLFKTWILSPAALERVMGIEPTLSAWEAEVLPLNYTRDSQRVYYGEFVRTGQ